MTTINSPRKADATVRMMHPRPMRRAVRKTTLKRQEAHKKPGPLQARAKTCAAPDYTTLAPAAFISAIALLSSSGCTLTGLDASWMNPA